MLGTHTFFMLFLPRFFYFGDDTTGRGYALIPYANVSRH